MENEQKFYGGHHDTVIVCTLCASGVQCWHRVRLRWRRIIDLSEVTTRRRDRRPRLEDVRREGIRVDVMMLGNVLTMYLIPSARLSLSTSRVSSFVLPACGDRSSAKLERIDTVRRS